MSISARLIEVLPVSDPVMLLVILKDWPTAELQALLTDVEAFAAQVYTARNTACDILATKTPWSTDHDAGKVLGQARDQIRIDTAMNAAQIASAAVFWLLARGITPT